MEVVEMRLGSARWSGWLQRILLAGLRVLSPSPLSFAIQDCLNLFATTHSAHSSSVLPALPLPVV
jgi:hypothetical protein